MGINLCVSPPTGDCFILTDEYILAEGNLDSGKLTITATLGDLPSSQLHFSGFGVWASFIQTVSEISEIELVLLLSRISIQYYD